MFRRETDTRTRSGDGIATLVIEDAAAWDEALITFDARGAAGSGLVIAPSGAPAANFTLNDGTAIVAPGANAAVHLGIGPGCAIGVPLPSGLVLSMTVVAGIASIRVELSRHVIGEDHSVDEIREVGKKIDKLTDRIDDVVIELRQIGSKR